MKNNPNAQEPRSPAAKTELTNPAPDVVVHGDGPQCVHQRRQRLTRFLRLPAQSRAPLARPSGAATSERSRSWLGRAPPTLRPVLQSSPAKLQPARHSKRRSAPLLNHGLEEGMRRFSYIADAPANRGGIVRCRVIVVISHTAASPSKRNAGGVFRYAQLLKTERPLSEAGAENTQECAERRAKAEIAFRYPASFCAAVGERRRFSSRQRGQMRVFSRTRGAGR